MKKFLTIAILLASSFFAEAQTRNVVVDTNSIVVSPTNFWSADATNARAGLGLGTAATNPASAFQPSSTTLSNLASNNAVNLTNLRATNIVGVIPSSNIPSTTLTNITGTLSIASGGTGATNASNARVNLGATATGGALFVSANAASARTVIGALATNGSAAGLTNFPTVSLASNVTGVIAISNGGTGATNTGGARTNLGLGNIFTNTFQNTNTAVYINTNIVATNSATYLGFVNAAYLDAPWFFVGDGTNGIIFETTDVAAITRTNLGIGAGATNTVGFAKIRMPTSGLVIEEPIDNVAVITFPNDTDPVVLSSIHWNNAGVRQSLGLGWPALTNTNAGTSLVSVNANGEVASPTNFWQVAPISTTVQYQTNVTGTSTNAATNSRNLFLFSLTPSVSGVTNTVTLPTNTATTFEGDRATIVHLATNSANTVTAIRQLGAATNIITLNQVDETVLLMYRGGQWRLADNLSFIEPIYFSGTNAAANAATTRTNLGLGATDNVTFQNITISDQTLTLSHGPEDDVFVRNESGNLEFGTEGNGVYFKLETSTLSTRFDVPIYFGNTTNAATTRTNLGIPLAALTNTTVTNFQKAIFHTNTAPSNIGGNLGTIAAWIEIVASNGVTYKIPAYTNVP